LVTLVLPVRAFDEAAAALARIEAALAGVPHEVIAAYAPGDDRLLAAFDAMPDRPRTFRLISDGGRGALAAAAEVAGGDVVVPLPADGGDWLGRVAELAAAVRAGGCAVAIGPAPRGRGMTAVIDWLLAAVGGMGAWNAATGFRAYAAEFLDGQEVASADVAAVPLELAVKAQLAQAAVAAVGDESPPAARVALPVKPLVPWLRAALLAPAAVYGLWAVMTAAAFATASITHWPMRRGELGSVLNVALPSAAVFALTLAVRRVRGRIRLADAFFSLVMLNPLFFARRLGAGGDAAGMPFDRTLLAAGLLGLMAGAIVAMKQDRLRRYLAVLVLALGLTALSDTFAMLLPAVGAWLGFVGFQRARAPVPRDRTRGFVILAAAEVALMVFGLACVLVEPTPLPTSEALFPTIVTFAEFPLLVIAILTLALGWRPPAGVSGQAQVPRHARVPPYFSGMLALLVGLLTMLLNNFEAGRLPPPGADQTVMIMCLVYTVFALHGPRRLQWLMPPLLLAAAAAYSAVRWHQRG
jgi:hypothetical protein